VESPAGPNTFITLSLYDSGSTGAKSLSLKSDSLLEQHRD